MGREGSNRKEGQSKAGLGVLMNELSLVSAQGHSLDP